MNFKITVIEKFSKYKKLDDLLTLMKEIHQGTGNYKKESNWYSKTENNDNETKI